MLFSVLVLFGGPQSVFQCLCLQQDIRIDVRALIALLLEGHLELGELLACALYFVVGVQGDGVVEVGQVVVAQLHGLVVRGAAVFEVIKPVARRDKSTRKNIGYK
jgi:hypothetical protein